MPPTKQPELDWRPDGIPVSRRFDDPYFSLAGGLAESRHVFLAGNDLPGRLCDGFEIAELGFGTGLNLLATVQAHQGNGHVRYTAFEAYPMSAEDITRALQPFPEIGDLASVLLSQWSEGRTTLTFPNLTATIVIGDARETLPDWAGAAHAWYLDGFSPAKNPELWSPDILGEVASHTVTGGTFATYTAAGHVRRSLAQSGFIVARQPGFGGKRHMSTGWLDASTG